MIWVGVMYYKTPKGCTCPFVGVAPGGESGWVKFGSLEKDMLKLRFCNKEHGDVWLVEPAVVVGSDAGCQAVLKREGIQARHLEIQIKGDQLTLVNLAKDKALSVNGTTVDGQAAIKVGDEVILAGMKLEVVDPKNDAKPAPVAATSEWAIRPNHSALANKIYSITGDTSVGRAPECDLSFSVAHLSRKHAQLFIKNGQLMVKDAGSANGTFVNGQKVEESKLNRGDELRLDTLSFTVIGPGGDSDKTVMRAAVVPMPLPPVSPTLPREARVAAAAESAAEREKKVVGVTAFNRAVTVSEAAKDAAASSSASSTSSWMLAAVALIAVVAVIGYVIFSKPL